MRTTRSLFVASLALTAALGTVPLAAASSAPAPKAPLAYDCPAGYFCIYSGWNGTGERCMWASNQRANTADDCGFIQRWANVLSVANKTVHKKQYYKATNYRDRVGSTTAGGEGNLQGNYQIRSFKPQ
ncbi:peptidase inhibitor family I36 protein [Streptomyces sp. PmtG]